MTLEVENSENLRIKKCAEGTGPVNTNKIPLLYHKLQKRQNETKIFSEKYTPEKQVHERCTTDRQVHERCTTERQVIERCTTENKFMKDTLLKDKFMIRQTSEKAKF